MWVFPRPLHCWFVRPSRAGSQLLSSRAGIHSRAGREREREGRVKEDCPASSEPAASDIATSHWLRADWVSHRQPPKVATCGSERAEGGQTLWPTRGERTGLTSFYVADTVYGAYVWGSVGEGERGQS